MSERWSNDTVGGLSDLEHKDLQTQETQGKLLRGRTRTNPRLSLPATAPASTQTQFPALLRGHQSRQPEPPPDVEEEWQRSSECRLRKQREKEKIKTETRSTIGSIGKAFFLFIQDGKIQKNMTMALKPNTRSREKWDEGQIKI